MTTDPTPDAAAQVREADDYPCVMTRNVGRKRYKAVLYSNYAEHKEKWFKTYDEASEYIERWIAKRDAETWRRIV